MTIPHYHPVVSSLSGSPFALAIWLGVWTSGGPIARGYRIAAGRLWVSSERLPGYPRTRVNMLPVERNAHLIHRTTPTPP